MFDYSFLPPAFMAAMSGQRPGVISEDPYAFAEKLGAPVPASGEFNVTPPDRYGTVPSIYSGYEQPTQAQQPNQPAPSPLSEIQPAASSLPDYMQGLDERLTRFDTMGNDVNDAVAHNATRVAEQEKRPKFNVGQFLLAWAGHLGDNLTKNPAYANSLKHKWQLEEIDREAQLKAKLPQQVGNSVIVPDGQGGYRTLFRDPSTPEAYALAQGLQQGTPGYAEAVRQYRLGAWSDAAMENREGLEGTRYNYRDNLQDQRLNQSDINNRRTTGTSRENNIRSTSTSRANSVRSTGQSNTNSIRSNETRPRTARRIRVLPNEARATGPNGEELVVRNGRWIDTRTGKPVR